jgi:hypothetical protein
VIHLLPQSNIPVAEPFGPLGPAPTDAMFSAFTYEKTCDNNTRAPNGWDVITLWLSIGLTMPHTREQTLKDLKEVYFLEFEKFGGLECW